MDSNRDPVPSERIHSAGWLLTRSVNIGLPTMYSAPQASVATIRLTIWFSLRALTNRPIAR